MINEPNWSQLHLFHANELAEMGLLLWDKPDANGKVLMLIHGDWLLSIPNGFELETISGKK